MVHTHWHLHNNIHDSGKCVYAQMERSSITDIALANLLDTAVSDWIKLPEEQNTSLELSHLARLRINYPTRLSIYTKVKNRLKVQFLPQ